MQENTFICLIKTYVCIVKKSDLKIEKVKETLQTDENSLVYLLKKWKLLMTMCETFIEPNPGESQIESDDSESESSASSESDIDEEFEAIKMLRLSMLEWCKCRHCDIMIKTIESFRCHEKATEYDDKLKSAENQGFTCVTQLLSFLQNISQDVLDVDALQCVEKIGRCVTMPVCTRYIVWLVIHVYKWVRTYIFSWSLLRRRYGMKLV